MRLFVPGRVCLLGEHSDWAGGHRRSNPALEKGYTIVCGTNQGIYAEVEPHPSALVLTSTTEDGSRVGPHQIPMQPDRLLEEARQGSFWSYIAGVAYQVMVLHPDLGGLVIDNYHTDLPVKKGLSSSAAICVLTARAFNLLYELHLSVRDEMELAYLGETTTPSRCGRMDQCCAFGSLPVLMTFDGDRIDTSELRVGADLHLVLADLQSHKDTRKILQDLNAGFPFAQTSLQRDVQHLLGPLNKSTVLEAVWAMEKGDAAGLGQLMAAAQQNFDRYAVPSCPEELAAPVLHRILNHPAIQPHIWGGKGVGSQGDGTVQFLTRSAEAQQAVMDILARDFKLPTIQLTIKENI